VLQGTLRFKLERRVQVKGRSTTSLTSLKVKPRSKPVVVRANQVRVCGRVRERVRERVCERACVRVCERAGALLLRFALRALR
jgi:hypothetical protein